MNKIGSQSSVKASKETTLNRSRFEKISAFEGIKISKETSDRFDGYDTAGLSGDQRRKVIREIYSKS